MKKLFLYGMGLTMSMAVANVCLAGNDGNTKTATTKDKKACNGKCTGKKACCKDKKTAN